MLFEWAEAIIIMQTAFRQYVPEKYHAKLFVVDVGPDVWFKSMDRELLENCDQLLANILEVVDAEPTDRDVAGRGNWRLNAGVGRG